MALLRARNGTNPAALYPVFETRQATVIGRDVRADIHIDDDRASRRHARILRAYGAWVVQDLKSSNGTLLDGKPLEKGRLQDGSALAIGNTSLTFHPGELLPPPATEIYGARPVETLREESGVFVYRARQAAFDRDVRVDFASPHRPLPPEVLKAGARAVREAALLADERIDPLVACELEPGRDTFVVLRWRGGETLESLLDDVLRQDLGARLRLVSRLADAALARGRFPALAGPLDLRQVRLLPDGRGSWEPSLAAVELPSIATRVTGSCPHLPWYVPYLAPEAAASTDLDGDGARAALVYSLGAIGYHLLTRSAPMGGGSVREILENHRTLDAAPANLLDPEIPAGISDLLAAMLRKDPARRPLDREEIMARIARDAAVVAVSPAPPVTPPVTARVESPPSGESVRRAAPQAPRPPRTGRAAVAPKPAPPPGAGALLYNLLSLPLWVLLWAVLFLGGWQISRVLFLELLGGGKS